MTRLEKTGLSEKLQNKIFISFILYNVNYVES